MKRRLIAAVAAILLAGVGALVLLSYVSGADQRALAGVKTVKVLVVTAAIPEGTPAENLGTLVTAKAMPALAVVPGTVSTLDQVKGRVATTKLQPGEQLLASRFADPASLEKPGEVKVPAGMHQLTLLLDAPRALGGYVTPGATVGVFVSLPKDTDRPGQTRQLLHKVLVNRVQGGITATPAVEEKPSDGAAAPVAAASVMVTLVMSAPDAEKVVFAAENGSIWLSSEPADASEKGTRTVTTANLYK